MATPAHCEQLASPNPANFALSIVILLGIVVSYLPQHLRIIFRRSSEGISPYFVLLGTTSGTCALFNILVLPTSRADLSCCSSISGFACFSALLGIAQVAVQWACFAAILVLFLLYFPDATTAITTTTTSKDLSSTHPTYKTALSVALLSAVHFIATLSVALVLRFASPRTLLTFANILGVTATVLASIQYFPQICTTWRLRHVGSLSIPMMLLQTPGSFLWAGSLAMRLGKQGWSAWGVYLVTGSLQGVLLGICIYLELGAWRRRKAGVEEVQTGDETDAADGEVVVDERTALLAVGG